MRSLLRVFGIKEFREVLKEDRYFQDRTLFSTMRYVIVLTEALDIKAPVCNDAVKSSVDGLREDFETFVNFENLLNPS